ncbi:HAD family phosphatase [Candidatus Woesearchaeota archaeon]|nr:HAD family phosphatase [Candidatus Woesearchaeota archaeon]
MIVFFDVGNVILPRMQRHIDNIATAGHLNSNIVAQALPLIHELQRGELTEAEFWKSFKRCTGQLPTNYKTLWSESFTFSPDKKVLGIAQKLREQGTYTGILSNTIAPHAKILRAYGLYDGFEPVILSCEVKARKPEKKIFEIAAKKAGVLLHECVHIDDDPEFVKAAKAGGMDAILYKNPEQLTKELQKRRLL